jgi:hypothetical protein
VADCFFAYLGDCSFRADGQPDRAHWIPAQRLRAEGVTGADIWDRRAWTPMCRRHHDRFDGRDALNKITLTRRHLPPGLEDYAAEHGLTWSLELDYPPEPRDDFTSTVEGAEAYERRRQS